MKILIQSSDTKLKLVFPLFFAKIMLPFIHNEELDFIKPHFKIIYKGLKKYIKKNGHFTLLEVESEDSKVKIIV